MSVFARIWIKAAPNIDERGGRAYRERLVAGLSGTVVEVGAGTGIMFDRYPKAVERVIALEPDPKLRAEAVKAAGPRIEVSDGVAERIPLGDGEADAVVFALVLCTVPEQATALAEARRVLKPGGQIRFWEHVHAGAGFRRPLLRFADRSGLWPALAGGCHPARETLQAIRAAGFTVEDVDEFDFRPAPLPPDLPFILGARDGVRRLLVLLGCCVAVAGCGNDEKKAADLAHYRAEQRALVEIATLQSVLAAAEQAYDTGDAKAARDQVHEGFVNHFALISEPLADADGDLEASLAADIDQRLRGELAAAAPDADVKRLFAQIQADLLTAADAIKA